MMVVDSEGWRSKMGVGGRSACSMLVMLGGALAGCQRSRPPPGELPLPAASDAAVGVVVTDAALAVAVADASPADATPSPALPSNVRVTVRDGAKEAELRYGVAHVAGGAMVVSLVAVPVSCAVWPTPPTPYLSFTVPRGPGDRYFAGATIGLETFTHLDASDSRLIGPEATRFTLDAGTSKTTMKGSLVVTTSTTNAGGTFVVAVCPVPVDPPADHQPVLPAAASPGPLMARYADTTVKVASASLHVARDDAQGRYADELFVSFVTPPALGGEVLESDVKLEMIVTLTGARGEQQRPLMTKPQPVWFRLTGRGNWGDYKGRGLPRPAWTGEGAGWIRFASVGFTPGDRFAAELVADGNGLIVPGTTTIDGNVRGVVIE
ncbi:MAG: hypothetical protein NT062_07050 [Proteobacteria bacterium]|nr:hypothetical protein [Pseudomonadota bacterium]